MSLMQAMLMISILILALWAVPSLQDKGGNGRPGFHGCSQCEQRLGQCGPTCNCANETACLSNATNGSCIWTGTDCHRAWNGTSKCPTGNATNSTCFMFDRRGGGCGNGCNCPNEKSCTSGKKKAQMCAWTGSACVVRVQNSTQCSCNCTKGDDDDEDQPKLLTCLNYTCPTGQRLQTTGPSVSKMPCNGTADCTKKCSRFCTPADCSAFTGCKYPKVLRNNASAQACPVKSGCQASKCCVQAPTCTGYNGCVAPKKRISKPGNKRCAAATCTPKECCA